MKDFKVKKWHHEDLYFVEFYKVFNNGIKLEITQSCKEEKVICTTYSLVINREYREIAIENEKELTDLIKILDKQKYAKYIYIPDHRSRRNRI